MGDFALPMAWIGVNPGLVLDLGVCEQYDSEEKAFQASTQT